MRAEQLLHLKLLLEKWTSPLQPFGKGSLSAETIFLTDITFPLKVPQASIPGAAWLWLSQLVFSPGQTRLLDILLCRTMWQQDFILFTLEEQHISCSCQEHLQTHKKEGKRQTLALPVCFHFCPILLCYCFSQGIAWAVP